MAQNIELSSNQAVLGLAEPEAVLAELEIFFGRPAQPVRARRLTDKEGQRLQQIVRRSKHGSVRVRRALIIMASASTLPPRLPVTRTTCRSPGIGAH
jgi:hypothetical protein